MNTIREKTIAALVLLWAASTFGQTNNLNITNVAVDEHGAITLKWNSRTNAIYRIECAPELSESPAWQVLYDWYPSHGTNTFWMDTGNNRVTPDINHPHDDALRFYRVVQVDTNAPASVPTITVSSPINNSLITSDVTNTVSIAATSSVGGLRWFVDGAEYKRTGGDTTNAHMNTCQWRNGVHILFAVGNDTDGGETTDPADQIGIPKMNFGITPYCNLNFSNYISDFRASSVFIHPQNAALQTFAARFSDYSLWTLTFVEYFSSNTVRTVTGAGPQMSYDWDGTGDGGVGLADGIYRVFLTATQTNAPLGFLAGSAHSIGYPVTDGGFMLVPLPPLPPGLAGPGPQPIIFIPLRQNSTVSWALSAGADSAVASVPSGGGQSQTTELDPPRIINLFGGKFGVVYQGHHPGNVITNGNLFAGPPNGLGGRVAINANTGPFKPLNTPSRVADNFTCRMMNAGYGKGFVLGNDDVTGNMLRSPTYGGTEVFEQVNIGLIIGHDVFGIDPDFTISGDGPRTSYYPIYHTGTLAYDWVQLAACEFGRGSNLRWMAHLSCNNLQPDVYDDMYNKEALPIGQNLHFFMGATTVSFMVADFGTIWADSMAIGGHAPIMPIKDAWFFAGHQTQGTKFNKHHYTVTFRVAGWSNTFNDTLYEYQDPDSGNPADIIFVDEQVYP